MSYYEIVELYRDGRQKYPAAEERHHRRTLNLGQLLGGGNEVIEDAGSVAELGTFKEVCPRPHYDGHLQGGVPAASKKPKRQDQGAVRVQKLDTSRGRDEDKN